MASPKLEVYEIRLQPRNKEKKDACFLDLFQQKLHLSSDENNEVFTKYFEKFRAEIDSKDYILDKHSFKGITAYDTSDDEDKSTIVPIINERIIKGKIVGGKYGSDREKASVKDKKNKVPLDSDDIILNKFYFLLYTPLDSDIGLLFLHSYSDDTVSVVFKKFIKNFFKVSKKYNQPAIHPHCPEVIKKEFRKGSIVSKFIYKQQFLANELCEDSLGEKDEGFIIKIEAVNSKGVPIEDVDKYTKALDLLNFGNGLKKLTTLKRFTEQKAYVRKKDEKRETPFVVGDKMDMSPIVYLDNRVTVSKLGVPDWEELEVYILSLLQDVKKEIYKCHEIKEC